MPKGHFLRVEETKAKMSASHKDMKFTDEHRKHLSESKKKLFADPESKARLMAALHTPEVNTRRKESMAKTRERKKLEAKQS